jgi:branched-chain amino acid aminotransferase
MPNLCNLDGVLLREDAAQVPVLDRGFLFGDSVYEVLATRDGTPFAWPEHLERLRASAHAIYLDIGLTDRELMARVVETVRQAGFAGSYIRIIVTRGTGTAPNIDLAHAPGPARCVILVRDLPAGRATATELALIDRLRNDARAMDPAVKSGNYLNNVLGLAEARAKGAADALFLNGRGHVTEATTANVWIVQRGVARTPPLSAGILAGVTRGILLERLQRGGPGLPAAEERDLTAADLRGADEIFLTSTLRDVLPVTKLDGRPVGSGRPGPVATALGTVMADECARRVREIYAPRLAALLER